MPAFSAPRTELDEHLGEDVNQTVSSKRKLSSVNEQLISFRRVSHAPRPFPPRLCAGSDISPSAPSAPDDLCVRSRRRQWRRLRGRVRKRKSVNFEVFRIGLPRVCHPWACPGIVEARRCVMDERAWAKSRHLDLCARFHRRALGLAQTPSPCHPAIRPQLCRSGCGRD